MAEPLVFSSSSSNFQLPLLFAGQAQKEPFINQSFAMIDALMSRVIIGVSTDPPLNAVDGEAYLVDGPASLEWTNMEDAIALRIAGAWHFANPIEGMTLFDKGTGRLLVYRSNWVSASEPPAPIDGNVIDIEARATLTDLINELKLIGLLSPFQT